MNIRVFLLVILFIISSGCIPEEDTSQLQPAIQQEDYKKWIKVWEQDGYVYATGVGKRNTKLNNETQELALAKNAAIANAQFNILAKYKSEGKSKKKITGKIKGAQPVKTEWKNSMYCVVTVRVDKQLLKNLK